MTQLDEAIAVPQSARALLTEQDVAWLLRIDNAFAEHDKQLVAATIQAVSGPIAQASANATVEALREAGWLRESAGILANVKRIQRDERGLIVAVVETRETVRSTVKGAADA